MQRKLNYGKLKDRPTLFFKYRMEKKGHLERKNVIYLISYTFLHLCEGINPEFEIIS